MSKGERISQFVPRWFPKMSIQTSETLQGIHSIARFSSVGMKRYYEAHDVLEQLWLKTKSPDADYFKGLIQAAGAFVHLQKRFEYPLHAKHSRRLSPAVRLFRLADKNLSRFAPRIIDWMWLHCVNCCVHGPTGSFV